MNRPILLDLLLGWLGFEDEDDEHEDEDEALHGPNACAKRKGPCHESPIPFGIPLRMKKYSARRVGLGARNLFRSGVGRTEVRAPVGLRRCRSEATVPYRRLGVSKSTVDSHFRGNFVLHRG